MPYFQCSKKIYALLAALLLQCFILSSANAEVILDGSLGTSGPIAGPNYAITASVGQQVGANLFHSFSDFNIYTNESATFTGPASIANIISRITGGDLSYIDGRITSAIPNANLFLLNPSGVMFGPNAVLDVSGSFAASTADYLRLGNNGRFDATNPNNSVLSTSPPSAFGFLGNNPASISVDGSFLEVPEGKTLSLIRRRYPDNQRLFGCAGWED